MKKYLINLLTVGAVFVLCVVFSVYYTLPRAKLNSALVHRLNSYLPPRVEIARLNFRSPLVAQSLLNCHFRGRNFSLPLVLQLDPGFSGHKLVIQTRPDRRIRIAGTWPDYTFTGKSNDYRLEQFLPGQEGTLDFKVFGSLLPPSGDFEIQVRSVKLSRASYLPALFRNRRVQEASVRGKITTNEIKFSKLSAFSSRYEVEGKGGLRLKKPYEQSKINLDLKLKRPIQKEYTLETTFRKLGII